MDEDMQEVDDATKNLIEKINEDNRKKRLEGQQGEENVDHDNLFNHDHVEMSNDEVRIMKNKVIEDCICNPSYKKPKTNIDRYINSAVTYIGNVGKSTLSKDISSAFTSTFIY